MPSFDDFDRYIEQHGIPEEDYPAAFALLITQHMDGLLPRFEKVERRPPADGRRRPAVQAATSASRCRVILVA
jgi:hypothetical protein